VIHDATAVAAERLAVIVGVGDLADRPESLEQALEPAQLMVRAAHLADQDAGGGWLARLTRIDIVNQIGWPYADLGQLLAAELATPRVATRISDVGGEMPVKLMMLAAAEIAAGREETVLIVGAEALRSIGQSMTARKPPAHWTPPDPTAKLPKAEDFVTPLARRYGAVDPVNVYPLYENALRTAWGQTFAQAQRESADIWADMSQVASRQQAAWVPKPRGAGEISSSDNKNRPVSFPYLKLMVAQIAVNQGAAFIVTSLARALETGVPRERLVYVWSGAGAHEPEDFFARDGYQHSTAMEAVLDGTLCANDLRTTDLAAVELYSCFPCVPKMARKRLGWPESAPVSVTGGLTFFGGPGNNYMSHAVAAMVRYLRAAAPGAKTLVYGQGAFVTKHHAAILSRQAPAAAPRNLDVQAQADAARAPVPVLIECYEGPAILETYTITYARGGDADRGIVVARTPRGERVVAEVPTTDRKTLAELERGEQVIGRSGHFQTAERLNRWEFDELSVPHLSIAGTAVLFERVDRHIAVISLNRPVARNAINGAIAAALAELTREVDEDPELRVAIITSTVADVFSVGADLNEVAAGRTHLLMPPGKGFAGFVDVQRAKPWIAAVSGFALGGGTEIALACDLIVASNTAQFGLPEVQRGLLAAAGGLFRLPRAIPPMIAAEFALTGESFGAERAYALGMVNRVVEAPQLREAALRLARRIAANAPMSVRASVALLREAGRFDDAEASRRSLAAALDISHSADATEGVQAFLARRSPQWRNQ
jgi:acetyl-CoA C-acetyltransferase